jgi:hypothetical protein
MKATKRIRFETIANEGRRPRSGAAARIRAVT